jgi:hypothetical protein
LNPCGIWLRARGAELRARINKRNENFVFITNGLKAQWRKGAKAVKLTG